MPGANARNNQGLPAELLRARPRDVRLKVYGILVAALAMVSAIGGLWGGAELYRRATTTDTIWPVYVVPVAGLICSLLLIACIRRQSVLLREGTPAMATVTKVKKGTSDYGSYWRVEYQWTLLSGATRTARYRHSKRQAPEIGSVIPILYDRDEPKGARTYPMSLVAVRM